MAENSRPDYFDNLHSLLRGECFEEALDLIVDRGKMQILSPYDSDLNHAWYVVGDIFYRTGEFAKSISAFKRAIEDWPDDVDAHLALGNAYAEAGDPGAARDALLRAYDISPGEPRLTYNLGNAYFDLGDLRKAEFFYKTLARTPDSEILRLARSNLETIKRLKPQGHPLILPLNTSPAAHENSGPV